MKNYYFGNIGFALQMLDDMAAGLECEFDRLATEEAKQGKSIEWVLKGDHDND